MRVHVSEDMGSGEAKRFRDLYSSAGRHGESFWREEKDNVGLKLLKSMGWENGQGLGKDGTGRTTAVKQFRKKDNSGIGSSAGTRDEAYRASQDLFNDVLSRLAGGGGDEDDSSKELGTGASTIKGMVAKRSLTRRFIRGNSGSTQTNNYINPNAMSAEESAAIFGRGGGSAWPIGGEQAADGDGDADGTADPLQQTSSISVNDYFARCLPSYAQPPLARPAPPPIASPRI